MLFDICILFSRIVNVLRFDNKDVTSADIRKELFEGENVLTREDKDKPRRFVNEDEETEDKKLSDSNDGETKE